MAAKRFATRWPKGVPVDGQKVYHLVAERFTTGRFDALGGQKVHHLVAKRCTVWWPNGATLGDQEVYH